MELPGPIETLAVVFFWLRWNRNIDYVPNIRQWIPFYIYYHILEMAIGIQ
jgi:hypothetical protein